MLNLHLKNKSVLHLKAKPQLPDKVIVNIFTVFIMICVVIEANLYKYFLFELTLNLLTLYNSKQTVLLLLSRGVKSYKIISRKTRLKIIELMMMMHMMHLGHHIYFECVCIDSHFSTLQMIEFSMLDCLFL